MSTPLPPSPSSSASSVTALVETLTSILPNMDVSVSVRTDAGVFLYVNDRWRRDFKVSPEGKQLSDLNISSPEEVSRSQAIDDIVLRQGSLVDLSTLVINGQPSRLAVVRGAVRFRHERYLIVVSWILGMNYSVSSPFGWSSDRADRAFADMIAARLQSLDRVVDDTLQAASTDLQGILAMVQAALDKDKK